MISTIITDPGNHLYIGDKGIFAFSIFGILLLVSIELTMEYLPKLSLLNHRYAAVRYATIVMMLILIISLGVFDGSQFIYFQF